MGDNQRTVAVISPSDGDTGRAREGGDNQRDMAPCTVAEMSPRTEGVIPSGLEMRVMTGGLELTDSAREEMSPRAKFAVYKSLKIKPCVDPIARALSLTPSSPLP